VRRFEEIDPSCAATVDALIALGVPAVDDYCAGIVEGVSLTQATQKRGLRHSAAAAFLRPALRRPNLTVLTGARALHLIMSRDRCVGVRALRGREMMDIYAERETILSAGAFGSPNLLLHSGIGPGDSLARQGVKTVHDLPGVGAHLNDHVNIKLSAFVNRPTYNTRRSGLSGLREGAKLLLTGSGAASSPANHAQAFVRTDPAKPLADVQLQVMPFGFGSKAEMARDGLTVVVSPCHPRVRGRVSLRSADPTDPPRIAISLLEQEADRAALLRGCKLALAALRAGPGRTMAGDIYAPSQGAPTDDEWVAFFRQTAALNWHPTSTCRMGPGRDDVVDHSLKVHGLAGLSVVDASIMPSVTSGNTNIPVIAIAERAAELIATRTS
jgi:choline dehydrogenase